MKFDKKKVKFNMHFCVIKKRVTDSARVLVGKPTTNEKIYLKEIKKKNAEIDELVRLNLDKSTTIQSSLDLQKDMLETIQRMEDEAHEDRKEIETLNGKLEECMKENETLKSQNNNRKRSRNNRSTQADSSKDNA